MDDEVKIDAKTLKQNRLTPSRLRSDTVLLVRYLRAIVQGRVSVMLFSTRRRAIRWPSILLEGGLPTVIVRQLYVFLMMLMMYMLI